MKQTPRWIALTASVAALALLTACATTPATGPMGFFVTSTGPGNGADLGGPGGGRRTLPETGNCSRCRGAHLARLPQHRMDQNHPGGERA